MMGLFVITVLILVSGIIYLEAQAHSHKKPRNAFLAELARIVEGRVEQVPGAKDSYRVVFTFDEKDFVFEDSLIMGFTETVNKAFLKVNTGTKFHLAFSEKKTKATIRSDMVIASQISGQVQDAEVKIKTPAEFNVFEIITNQRETVNRLFDNFKLASFFRTCKNADSRGCPFMSFKVIEGTVTLEFQSLGSFSPSLNILYKDVNAIENFLKSLSLIADSIKHNR